MCRSALHDIPTVHLATYKEFVLDFGTLRLASSALRSSLVNFGVFLLVLMKWWISVFDDFKTKKYKYHSLHF